jgi:hypothetical protein
MAEIYVSSKSHILLCAAVVPQAVSLKARIEQENAARAALEKAMKRRDLSELAAALATCSELGLEEDIVKQAQALKEELEEQQRAVDGLKEAMTDRGLEVRLG